MRRPSLRVRPLVGWVRVRCAALALVALALTGCQTTAEKSAKIERAAKQLDAHAAIVQKGLSITHTSTAVKVLSTTLVSSSEGAAAVVTVRNLSAHALSSVPIAITVENASGQTTFQNNAPGLEASLTSIPSLSAHGLALWIDDQLPSAGRPTSVSVRVGEAQIARGPLPRIEVHALHASDESGPGAAGTVINRSTVTQRKLIVYVIALRAGKVLAAGRAILPELAPGASAPFQVLFVGAARGATLQASAPATTLG